MKKILILLGLVLFVIIFSAGCIQSSDSNQSSEKTTIRVTGAYAMYPLMLVWAEKYQEIDPNVKIVVSAGGAGKGMTDVITGQAEIGMISRDVYPEEEKQGVVGVTVGKDAVVLTANENNPIREYLMTHGVNRSVLSQIFVNSTITRWDYFEEKVGNKEIHVFTRADSCGAAEVWAKYLGVKQENLKGTGVSGDPGIAEAVSRDTLGLGYNNINYAYDPVSGNVLSGLSVIPLDIDDNGEITPDEDFYDSRTDLLEAIAKGWYPSPPARDLHLAMKDNFSGEAGKFIAWIINEGQQYTEPNGYIPLSSDKQKKMSEILSTHSS